MVNRRKLGRKPLVSSLEIYSRDARKNLGRGYVTNLNEEGLGLVSRQALAVGEEVILDFGLPNGWKFDFFGTIVYAEEGVFSRLYGVKFSPGQGTFVFKLI
ncbi:MAG: PilZ domain-containing protein [Endomicrobiales bacterium]